MHMHTSHILTILVLIGIIAIAGYIAFGGKGGPDRDSDIAQLQKEDARPYTDLEGNPIDLSQYAGVPLVVNSWATWCPFCVNELPDFARLKEEFGDQIEVIAINRKESSHITRAFIDSLGDTRGIHFLLDSEDTFYKSIGGFSMPETVFYDSEGNIVIHKRGFMELEEMRTHVEAARAVTETES